MLRILGRAISLLVVSILPASAALGTEYRLMRLFELACTADAVLVGTIQAIRPVPKGDWTPPCTFSVAVEKIVVGSDDVSGMRIAGFRSWTCAGRWADYHEGQRVVLFLRKPAEVGKAWSILGAGGEGELPIAGTEVCVRDMHAYRVLGYDVEARTIGAVSVEGSYVPLDAFADAVRAFRTTYEWSASPKREPVDWIRPRESAEEVEAFAERSVIARHLHDEVASAHCWKGAVSEPAPRSFPEDALRIEAGPHGFSGAVRFGPGRKPDEFGSGVYTGFGRSCAFLGDVDGDGVEDLAVGAPNDSYLGHFHGALWILRLDAAGKVRNSTEIREEKNGFPARMNEFASLGESVAALGDLDTDGVPDLAVGASGWDGSSDHRGGVWICFLTKEGTVARSIELGAEPQIEAVLAGPGRGLGSALANLGDLDGDGFPELAISHDPAFRRGFDEGRSVLIVSLGRAGVVRWVRRMHDRADGFAPEYSWLGDAIAGLGDVGGDGVPDLALSNPEDNDGGDLRGAVWLVHLGSDGTIRSKQKISDWHGKFDGTLHDGSSFGSSLCGVGRVDSDETPDLLVASTEGLWTLFLRPDGSVREHRLTAIPRASDSTPRGTIRALSMRRFRSESGEIGLGIGGTLRAPSSEIEAVAWLMKLAADGTITSW